MLLPVGALMSWFRSCTVRIPYATLFTPFFMMWTHPMSENRLELYAEAFARHEERFTAEMERVHKWRAALTEAANLSGWDLQSLANGYDIF